MRWMGRVRPGSLQAYASNAGSAASQACLTPSRKGKEGAMIKVGFIHQVFAYLAAAVAVSSVILAGVCRLVAHPVGFALFSWMTVAAVAMLFAIYFFVGGIYFRNTQVRPLAGWQRKRKKVESSPSYEALKLEKTFSISGNNKGLSCPFQSVICQEGYCEQCQIYLDRQKAGRDTK